MAQLARCPACYSEIELPAEVADGELAGARAQCPACEETFLLADAKPRMVKQAVLVRESADVARTEERENSQDDFAEGAARIAASIDNPTLAAFLGLDKTPPPSTPTAAEADEPEVAESEVTASDVTASESTESESIASELIASERATTEVDRSEGVEADDLSEATKDTTPAIDLGDFQSLDELFQSSAKRTTEPSAAPEVANREDESEISAEPSPAADRLRPTLGELFAATTPAAHGDNELSPGDEDSSGEENLDQQLDDFLDETEHAEHGKSTVEEFGELTMHDMAVPKFAAEGEEQADEGVEVAKSLRAAMGFGDDEPLVAEESDVELAAVAVGDSTKHEEELSFAQVEAPRGTVATRRRKSPSMLRTMFGIVMGGVTGIVGGYLALLWIFHFVGRTDDPLDVAKFYPDMVKPAEFRSSAGSPVPLENPLASNDDIAPLPETFGDTGEVDQANFETESPLAGSDGSEASDAEAPAAWDDPAEAAPLAQPATKVVVEGAPQYTAAQVQEATADANAVAADLVADGPLDQRKGTSYATLAQLADALTFGEGDSKVSWKLPARQLFPQLFATPAAQENIAKIAGYWITSPNRSYGGIFFSGTLDAGRQQGTVAEYQVTLPTGQVLAVLTPQPLDAAEGAKVAVIGSLVRDPAMHVQGYTGTADMAVWSEHLLPLSP